MTIELTWEQIHKRIEEVKKQMQNNHLTMTWKEFEKWKDKNNIETFKKMILDVGCRDNKGQAVFEILGMVWIGIDKKPLDMTKVFTMDMTRLDFRDENFDFVFICHSLEHCENPLQALREFKRVLVKGGYLFISLPCPCTHHILNADDDHIFCFTDEQIKRLLTYTEFETIEVYNGEFIEDHPDTYNLIAVARK